MRLSAHRHIVRANTWLCSAETFLRCCRIPRNTSAMNQALVIILGVVHLLLLGLLGKFSFLSLLIQTAVRDLWIDLVSTYFAILCGILL